MKKERGKKMYQTNPLSHQRKKGRSLCNWVDNYVLLDIETTGLSPQTCDIIEIGAIKVRENRIVDQYESLIKIEDRIPPFITRLTGITNQMMKQGKEAEIVLQEFIEFSGDDILMGHNVNFDINFIYDKCQKYLDRELTNDFVDTMRLAKNVLPSSPNYKLGTLASYFQVDYSSAHRGLKDVEITYKVYNKLREIATKK
jgi:DNA polymerase-3 subunit epsilon